MMFRVLKLTVTVPDLLCDSTCSTRGFEFVCMCVLSYSTLILGCNVELSKNTVVS